MLCATPEAEMANAVQMTKPGANYGSGRDFPCGLSSPVPRLYEKKNPDVVPNSRSNNRCVSDFTLYYCAAIERLIQMDATSLYPNSQTLRRQSVTYFVTIISEANTAVHF